MNSLSKIGLIAGALIALVIGVSAATYGLYRYTIPQQAGYPPAGDKERVQDISGGKNDQDLSRKDAACPESLVKFKHDVIGVSFCYPAEWGAPRIFPINELTRLAGLEEDLDAQSIAYKDTLDIAFEKNSQIRLRLFNDRYSGDDAPYAYYEAGATESVADLKNTGNICKYEIGFNYKYNAEMAPNSLKTIYSDCSGGIKTVLTENREFFDFNDTGTLYTYDLRLLSFRKLVNGYFDNVLASRKVDEARQIREKLITLDGFFSEEKTTNVENGLPAKNKEQLASESEEFRQFINSIVAFKPAPKIQKDFKENSGEDSNVTAIRRYYWLLAGGKLEEAYKMRSSVGNVSFEKFKEWYGRTSAADVSLFEERASDQYRFRVDYQDNNTEPEVFRVEMKIIDGKLSTVSTEKMIGEKVAFGNMEAFAKQEAGYNYMILAKDGKEITVDKAEEMNEETSNIGEALYFSDPIFSPSGNYLTYRASGWEWSFVRMYDIKNKIVNTKIFSPETYSFTDDEKYFFDCEANAMGGEFHGRVYTVPGFKVKYDLPFEEGEAAGLNDIGCEYDKTKQVVRFTVYNPDEDSVVDRIVEYSLKTNKAIIK